MLLDLPADHDSVLERMAAWGVKFDQFFDIGAARGGWGSKVRKHWPESSIFFFEAAPVWLPHLQQTAARLGGQVEVLNAAAGGVDGEAYFHFDPADPYGGALIDKPGEHAIRVPMVTLDTVTRERLLDGRFALKLDTHGAERAIFSGASRFMERCDFVVFETYNFGPAARRFGQMAVFLEEEFGLRCIDIAEPKWRPYDNALWQLDLYFVRPEKTKLAEWRLA